MSCTCIIFTSCVIEVSVKVCTAVPIGQSLRSLHLSQIRGWPGNLPAHYLLVELSSLAHSRRRPGFLVPLPYITSSFLPGIYNLPILPDYYLCLTITCESLLTSRFSSSKFLGYPHSGYGLILSFVVCGCEGQSYCTLQAFSL